MDLAKKRDIQSVVRLSNVFKEQFNLFFCEKNGRVDGRKTGENTYTFP